MLPTLSPSLNERCMSYLTFSEVSGLSRVARPWRATADKVRQEMVQSGINTGFLYKMTDPEFNSGYLYVDKSDATSMSVLALNPLLRAAFTKADTVAAGERSTEELREAGRAYFEKLKTGLNTLSADRLTKMHLSILRHLEQSLTAEQFAKHNARISGMSIDQQILLGFAESCIAVTVRPASPTDSIGVRAQQAHKKLIDFSAQDLHQHPTFLMFKLLGDFTKDHPRFLEFLAHNIAGFTQEWSNSRLAWRHGHNTFADKSYFPISAESLIDDEAEKAAVDAKRAILLNALTAKTAFCELQLQKSREPLKADSDDESHAQDPDTQFAALSKQCDQALADFEAAKQVHKQRIEEETARLQRIEKRSESQIAQYADKSSEQIVELLQQTQSPLVVLSTFHEGVIKQLKERGIGIHGPLLAPLKPRGFLWKVTDPRGREGHLVGSIHNAPTSLLNFNRAMCDAFNKAGVLAVEVVQSKEFDERMSFEKDKYLKSEIGSLPVETQDRLATLFRAELAGMTLPPGIEVPQEREQFLRWMSRFLRPLALHRLNMGKGIDHQFIEMATAQNKPIEGLEDIALHAEHAQDPNLMLSLTGVDKGTLTKFAEGGSEDVQQILLQMQQQLKKAITASAKICEFGLIEEMESRRAKGLPDSDEEIMKRRNQVMANSVARLIASGRNPFCVIGAYHMTGNDSMLKILQREHACRVQQIFCEEPDAPKLLQMCKKV